MRKTSLFIAAFVCFSSALWAGPFKWFQNNQAIHYSLEADHAPVISMALQMWQADMRQATGLAPTKSKEARVKFILYKPSKQQALQKLDAPLQGLATYKDAYFIKVSNQQLYVVGSDARGLAYGILALSRLAGVSPWTWWGDLPAAKVSSLSLPDNYSVFEHPKVEYRGVFINDEDWSFQPWSWKQFDPQSKKGLISAKAYKKLFQLLLRLRANTLLPAMHGSSVPFYLVPGAMQVADSCGIVISTSHCEPLLSNANGEWDDKRQGAYNYMTNRDSVLAFWSRRLMATKQYQNIYTMGMRGKHDGPMAGVKTLDEKTIALQAVINDQRALLKKYINPALDQIPQQFVPYKEVLDIYKNGLRIPEDIMLTWTDDNYGYITRLSDSSEQHRSGGGGLYYHLSYWGRPHDYLWLTTTQPGLMYNELKNAYQHQVRRMWIVNVHDPKIAGYNLELFLDMAWDIDLKDSEGKVASKLKSYLTRDFGEAGPKLYPALRDYYYLTAVRKPEFMGWTQVELDKTKYNLGMSEVQPSQFSFSSFSDEADRYLAGYAAIKQTVDEVAKQIPPRLKDAYFARIQYPLKSAAAMATKWLEWQRALSLKGDADKDKRLAAKVKSLAAYEQIEALTAYYNTQLAGGKWQYLMSDHPRDLNVFAKPIFDEQPTKEQLNTYATSKGGTETQAYPIQQDDSFIARNASSFDKSSFKAQPEPMLGHSMNSVPIPKGEQLRYRFTTSRSGMTFLRTAVIPTHPNDNGDIRYQVQIDQQNPQIISFRQDGRTEAWKQNVLSGQAVAITPIALTEGAHELKITALDPHVILDQWMIDFQMDRKFYLFPVAPVEIP